MASPAPLAKVWTTIGSGDFVAAIDVNRSRRSFPTRQAANLAAARTAQWIDFDHPEHRGFTVVYPLHERCDIIARLRALADTARRNANDATHRREPAGEWDDMCDALEQLSTDWQGSPE